MPFDMDSAERVRLVGEGWYIEVDVCDDGSAIEVRCAGNIVGSSNLIVEPRSGNVVRISCDAAREAAIHQEAHRLFDGWKTNEENDVFKTKKKRRKK
jgi:hypothetical protein